MKKGVVLIVIVISCVSVLYFTQKERFTTFFRNFSFSGLLSQSLQGVFGTDVSGTIDNVEAKRVVGVIKDRCEVDLPRFVDIRKDTSLSFPSYKIEGSQVTYNGDTYNNTALYAVARISEDLLDAKMLWPSDDGIFCKNKPTDEQIKTFLSTYKKEWKPDYYFMNFGATLGVLDKTWFHWHHMSTQEPEPLYNASPFLGMAQKYPQMAGVPESQINSDTKIDLNHPDLPKIMYDKWVADGRPRLVSLFEIDGGNYNPYIDDFPMPEGLNPYEEESFKYVIQTGGEVIRTVGQKKKIGNTTYTITDYFANNIKTWLPFYGTSKLVLTPQYIKGYKNIEQYFKDQGVTNVRFMIYGYARYWYLPPDLNVDLSNFDLFYTSPVARIWSRSEMEADIANWQRWERTGATMIWRPNLWFRSELDPHFNFNLHNEFVTRMKPDGYMITGYQPGSIPGIQAVNFYTMFKTLQGNSPTQALDNYISGFANENQAAVRQYIAIAEKTVLAKKQFTNTTLNEMMNALSSGNNDPMMQYLKKGVEVSLKKNEYVNGLLSKDSLISWFSAQLQQFPGLGNVTRFTKSVNDLTLGPITEDLILPEEDPILPPQPPTTTIPTLGGTTPTSSTPYTLTLLSSIDNTGGISPSERGFQYGLDSSYGTSLPERAIFSSGPFSLTIVNLTCGKTYYVRSFAINIQGIGYGSGSTAQTASCPEIKTDIEKKEDPLPPKEVPKTPEKETVPDVPKPQTQKTTTTSNQTPIQNKEEFVSVIKRKELIVTPSTSIFIPKGEEIIPPTEDLVREEVAPIEEVSLDDLIRKAKEALLFFLIVLR